MDKKLIGICGFIGSGKDTAAQYLIDNHNFTKLSFASALKDVVAAVFGWDRVLLEGASPESRAWRERVDTWWAARLNMPHLTPRWVLQYWGTEVCRTGFHQDIWVAALENQIRLIDSDIVITDCRFKNELDLIKKLGGSTVRIERGTKPDWYENARLFNIFNDTANLHILHKHNVHASEYSSVGYEYDHFIANNGTLDELCLAATQLVNL
jgi:hypothetical protein